MRHLQEKGFHTTVRPFFSERTHFAFYQSGNLFSKIHALVESYWGRLSLLLHGRSFDFIFIHREAAPAGPPVIEWWLAKVLKKNVIYDFDDAIWLTDKTDESRIEKYLRCRGKVKWICRWSYRVSCGNKYLASYARQYTRTATIMPTTIDTVHMHTTEPSSKMEKKIITIGWTGSHSTLKYLQDIVPVLKSLELKYPHVETLVIADKNPELPLERFNFRAWNKKSEIRDLAQVDIGIMPLPADDWTKGKCGFKALQYMTLEIPAVVSPIGVNSELIEHGKEGYLCNTLEDWFLHIEKLVLNGELRKRMGKQGRQKVIEYYSVEANCEKFLSLFQ